MKKFIVVGLVGVVFLASGSISWAQEPTVVDHPDSLGDFIHRFQERMQLLMTRDQERKAAMELKFADRREAQLQRCEAVTDGNKKEGCLRKLKERSDKLFRRLENRADKLGRKRLEVLEKVKEARERRGEKLQMLQERREGSLESDEVIKGVSVSSPDLLDVIEEALDNWFGRKST
ncbi:MAG: hypothetical protein HY381_02550 [Candidatus Chisholmbacteria bacterium]|nr:hypothetical protein [Candidatus Chisholmbacteria bacterium]